MSSLADLFNPYKLVESNWNAKEKSQKTESSKDDFVNWESLDRVKNFFSDRVEKMQENNKLFNDLKNMLSNEPLFLDLLQCDGINFSVKISPLTKTDDSLDDFIGNILIRKFLFDHNLNATEDSTGDIIISNSGANDINEWIERYDKRFSSNKLDKDKYEWTRKFYLSYLDKLNNIYGDTVPEDQKKNVAYWLVCQSAFESGYGSSAKDGSHNYGGHKSNNKKIFYKSDDDFINAYFNMLRRNWPDFIKARSLDNYLDIVNPGGAYNYLNIKKESLSDYKKEINGCKRRVADHLGIPSFYKGDNNNYTEWFWEMNEK